MAVDWLLSPFTLVVELDLGLQFVDLLNRRTNQMLGNPAASRRMRHDGTGTGPRAGAHTQS